jgi:NTP pyrophosphatase (non-canonical NTP hydrolase)
MKLVLSVHVCKIGRNAMIKMEELKKNSKLGVSHFQDYIADLYFDINQQRDFSDIYGYVHRNIGYLGKSIGSDDVDPSKFILLISWLFSLTTKLKIDILESLIRKFPGYCPYCLSKPCMCYKTNKTPYLSKTLKEIESDIFVEQSEKIVATNKKFSLDDSIEFITGIYPYNEIVWKSSGYQSHILKIHEELTEIHEANSLLEKEQKPKTAVMDEIADVFAWILSAWAILFPKDSLDEAFKEYYKKDCPVCESGPCKCELRDSRPATLPNFEEVPLIVDNLKQLASYFNNNSALNDLIESYQKVQETQKMPLFWATLIRTKTSLDSLVKIVTTLDVEGNTAATIYVTRKIVNKILKTAGKKKEEDIYDVFLSYSTDDRDQVREIHDFLKKMGLNVFMAEKSIIPSWNWEDIIFDSLNRTKLFCVIASPKSLKSEWVQTETISALALKIQILPILHRCSFDDLPDRLKRLHSIDFYEYTKILDALDSITQ